MHHLAREIAALHCQSLNRSFLSTLGVPFLTRLYDAMLADDTTIVIYEYQGSELKGFVTGGRGLKGYI